MGVSSRDQENRPERVKCAETLIRGNPRANVHEIAEGVRAKYGIAFCTSEISAMRRAICEELGVQKPQERRASKKRRSHKRRSSEQVRAGRERDEQLRALAELASGIDGVAQIVIDVAPDGAASVRYAPRVMKVGDLQKVS